ncbi:hypothetical protein IWW34DRAFT_891918 [Fusarium oxysporum f. sp. albedinis]|nr:hypothetical protein IWW34DRAFT_891918 [Fusarium oxysporum f. sp. albedinis]KAJ0126646.1 hypothetical protein HZ326_30246 [Fusarium oxysporum f. sp. albedinis]
MASNIEDKNAEPINKGDHVWTRIRGGRHEGDVERIVTTALAAHMELRGGFRFPVGTVTMTGPTWGEVRLGGSLTTHGIQ